MDQILFLSMETEVNARVSTGYLLIVLLLMLILPVVSIGIEYYTHSPLTLVSLIGKWFVFWAIGVRLFTAGFRQVIKPAFTLRNIFNIDSPDSTVIVKELGFANICFGAAAIISIFVPAWRPATGDRCLPVYLRS